MNQDVANISLMFVLPLGITFITILQTAAAPERMHKIIGAGLSFLVVVMDCLFYFTKNSFISYNADGGLLLAFASLLLFGILNVIRSEDVPAKVANILFCVFMLSAFVGIAYWERPTLLVTADYTPAELAAQNAKYQDYIASFQNGEGGKWQEAPKGRSAAPNAGTVTPGAQPSESEREQKSQQALAINNNATALNKKTLGLFHPHESSEAHSEIIQASESVRLAAYSLYTYTLQENAQEQANQYSQCRNQITQARVSLDRFWKDIENLKSNYQPQQEDN